MTSSPPITRKDSEGEYLRSQLIPHSARPHSLSAHPTSHRIYNTTTASTARNQPIMPSPNTDQNPLNPPPGPAAHLSIINTTTTITNLATHHLMRPPMPSLPILPPLPAWSFLIESPTTGQRALYDLGVPPNWAEADEADDGKGGFAPTTIRRLRENGWEVRADKGVAEVLEEGGVERGSVGSVIWR